MARADSKTAARGGGRAAALSVACVLAAALAARGADPDEEFSNPAVPHAVMFQGVVDRVSNRALRVGNNTVLLASRPWYLPLADGTTAGHAARTYADEPSLALGRYAAARVGDTVIVNGSLREDGKILAYAVWPSDWPVDASFGVPAEPISGVCEDAGDGWVVVAGRRVAVGEFTPFDDSDRSYGFTESDMLRVGDAVFLQIADDEIGGANAAVYAKVRQTGGGTILDGTIRGWDGGEILLDVDGVPAEIDDYTTVVAPDGEWTDVTYFESDDILGRRARIEGYLRDGRIYADRCVVTGEPDESAVEKRAASRRPGRLRMRGVVTATTSTGVEVNGLAAELRASVARRVASRWKIGGRIRVDARLTDGRIVARAVARR